MRAIRTRNDANSPSSGPEALDSQSEPLTVEEARSDSGLLMDERFLLEIGDDIAERDLPRRACLVRVRVAETDLGW